MNAIAINVSPRPGGNTEIMFKKVLESLEGGQLGSALQLYQERVVIQNSPMRGHLT
jgi:hypothetical protein